MKSLVLGAGLSGVAAANLLVKRGHNVSITDARKETPQMINLDPNVVNCCGTESLESFDELHLIVTSPGIPPESKWLQEAKSRGIPVRSEVEIALQNYDGSILAITGTNGKSTTTKMLECILKGQGIDAIACGNIGLAVSEVMMQPQIPNCLCIELSSYQLSSSEKLSADFSAILNFSFDHLSFHKTMADYFAAKFQMATFTNGKTFVNEDFESLCKTYKMQTPMNVSNVNKDFLKDVTKALPHLSKHDLENATFALTLAASFTKKPIDELVKSLKDYKALPHRFEVHQSKSGITFINDSKATNLDACYKSIQSLDMPATVLIGGQGKGESFSAITDLKENIHHIVTFGPLAASIEEDLSPTLKVLSYESLAEAFKKIEDWFDDKRTTLFAPGGASFDEFSNFEKRGDFFVKEMLRKIGV